MLIESRIKPVAPKVVRNITLFGTRYVFTPVLPGRFVAQVTDELHIKTFLDNPAYAEFKDELPTATLQRGEPTPAPTPAQPVDPTPPTPILTKDELPEGGEEPTDEQEGEDDGEELAAGGASDEPGEWSTAIADEAAALLRNPAASIATAVSKVTQVDVIRCALAMERNRTGKQKPRASVIELLEGTLRDIAAAGV